jgi:hypothetical protein
MEYLFIEAPVFMKRRDALFAGDDDFRDFQMQLAGNPGAGDVIPGCAPLRKTRWQSRKRGQGKRGGCRIIYLWIPEIRWIFLILAYGKDERDDLSSTDKKRLREMARQLRRESLAIHGGTKYGKAQG